MLSLPKEERITIELKHLTSYLKYMEKAMSKLRKSPPEKSKRLTRPIEALATAGAMDVDVDEQQKILVLTNLTKLTPIILTADNKQFY
jgi:hypothetical protein